jgi:hypothetical protein
MDECDRYWAYTDYLPLDQVVTYWCEQSGFDSGHCREGKKAAILKACADGDLAYRRIDGKTFNDPVEDLAARGIVGINRDSFDTWVTAHFASETPLPEKVLKTNERNSLLTVLAAVCEYAGIKFDGRGAAGQIAKMTEEIGAPVTDDTIRAMLAKIPDAVESRKK